jgi:hypothetical protein
MRIRQLCLGFLLTLILILPGLLGIIALNTKIGFCLIAASFLIGGYIALKRTPSVWVVRIALMASSTAMTLVIIDLGARWFLDDIYHIRWGRMPLLSRYSSNKHIIKSESGDLSAVTGDPKDREYRTVEFITDQYGFRNEVSDPANVDLIVVGDSYAAGLGTTQKKTFTRYIADRYKLTAVNIAVPGNAWDEYMNTALTLPRLDLSDKAVILWMLFPANDMGGRYPPIWNVDELPWKSKIGTFLTRYETFRYLSPIRSLLYRTSGEPGAVIRKTLPDRIPILFYARYAEEVVKDITVHEKYESFTETVKQMGQLVDRHEIRLVIVMAPSKEEVYEWILKDKEPWSTNTNQSSMSAELEKFSARENHCYIDLKPALMRHARRIYEANGGMLWWRDDTHWNEAGHSVVADELAVSNCLSSVISNGNSDVSKQSSLSR